jgi:serine/threonine-protein kinase
MLAAIPQNWTTNTNDIWAREIHAECLAADGRARDAIAPLEAAYQTYLKKFTNEFDLREVRRKLGDAHDRVGDTAQARALLSASLDEFIAKEAADSQWTLRIHERWGRFLLDHAKPGDADFATAEAQFRGVIEKAADRPLAERALAHAGLARIVAARGDYPGALSESRQALAALDHVPGEYDLRLQPQLWLVHSNVLLKNGDPTAARQWAEKALNASRHYDDPSSPAIAQAEAAVHAATDAAHAE